MARPTVDGDAPRVDPRAASRARAAVEAVEDSAAGSRRVAFARSANAPKGSGSWTDPDQQLFWERKLQAEEAAKRRVQRRLGSVQIVLGFVVALGGLTFGGTLRAAPTYYGAAVQVFPILIGGGLAALGFVRLLRRG